MPFVVLCLSPPSPTQLEINLQPLLSDSLFYFLLFFFVDVVAVVVTSVNYRESSGVPVVRTAFTLSSLASEEVTRCRRVSRYVCLLWFVP